MYLHNTLKTFAQTGEKSHLGKVFFCALWRNIWLVHFCYRYLLATRSKCCQDFAFFSAFPGKITAQRGISENLRKAYVSMWGKYFSSIFAIFQKRKTKNKPLARFIKCKITKMKVMMIMLTVHCLFLLNLSTFLCIYLSMSVYIPFIVFFLNLSTFLCIYLSLSVYMCMLYNVHNMHEKEKNEYSNTSPPWGLNLHDLCIFHKSL